MNEVFILLLILVTVSVVLGVMSALVVRLTILARRDRRNNRG